ncbi:MAG: leucine-rich repeat domain-containing protein [Treponema sp.]|jgi:hypothetical protein|nr:leucine-rich repeat domain-containing protein [Treponema sp.]
MKKLNKNLWIIAIGAVIGFTAALLLAACGGGGGGAAALLKKLNGSGTALEKTLSTVTPEALAELANINGSPGGDFSYGLNEAEDGIQIKKYTGKDAVVIIPSKIEDYPVVEINGNAFTGGYQWEVVSFVIREYNVLGWDTSGYVEPTGGAEMTAVVIPSGVTSIWRSAFRNCKKLHTVVLPDTLESIGANAFDGAGELYNLIIPETLTSLEFDEGNNLRAGTTDAFAGCSKLKLATRKRLQELGYTGEF